MSEIINNSKKRIDELKGLILDLHNGVSVEETRKKLSSLMASVPYNVVVQAEEELIKGGLSANEILKHCDLHSEALKGNIDTSSAKKYPAGHPVDTFVKENNEIVKQLDRLKFIAARNSRIAKVTEPSTDATAVLAEIHSAFNSLMDIEKHYMRKENLVFSYLEKHGITGPPMVMWGKDDEVRGFLKSTIQLLRETKTAAAEELDGYFELVFNPAIKAVEEMIYKEEKILFPMCMDTFTEDEWYEIYKQGDETGYCLYFPVDEWKPERQSAKSIMQSEGQNKSENGFGNGKVKLSTGSFTLEELEGFFGALPVDITFVDKNDNVRFFSHGEDRIFQRDKAILGRKVQFCHPPSSVHVVEKILNDFKSGAQDSAKFWINIKGKFVHIAYYAVRNEKKEYLGVVEITQDIAPFKAIEGERRILEYDN
jgi:DUF438 domain-containing protein